MCVCPRTTVATVATAADDGAKRVKLIILYLVYIYISIRTKPLYGSAKDQAIFK